LARIDDLDADDRVLSAMVLCEECQALDRFHAFLTNGTAAPGRISAFCPNAVYLLARMQPDRHFVRPMHAA
jgi:hypothetical protein